MLSKQMFDRAVRGAGARETVDNGQSNSPRKAVARKRTTPEGIQRRKSEGPPITLVSAYDYPTARWADEAGIDILFVSDALGTVALGRENTLSVTVDEIIHHTRAVRTGSGKCLVLASMPFQSHSTEEDGIRNAARIVKEGGAHAVEIEGTASAADTVRSIVDSGVAVVAHVGLTKGVASRTGHYRVQGRTTWQAASLIQDALAFEQAGAFALVLECIPRELAEIITGSVALPTIGIGSGPHCDGQALITQDMLGMFDRFLPSFVRKYASVSDIAIEAMKSFKEDVAERMFPDDSHSTSAGEGLAAGVLAELVGTTSNVIAATQTFGGSAGPLADADERSACRQHRRIREAISRYRKANTT